MSRLSTLVTMYESFKETGMHFLTKSVIGYHPPIASDDLGYFFYTIFLAHLFDLIPLQASQLFFYLGIGVSLSIIVIAFLSMTQNYVGCGLVLLCIIRLVMPLLHLNPPYIAYLSGVSSIAIMLLADFYSSKKTFFIAAVMAGILGSIADTIRNFAILPLFIFYIIYLLFTKKISFKNKIIFIVLFCIAYSGPYFYYMHHLKKRNVFLVSQGQQVNNNVQHVFWHNIYTGLGFLNNNENIIWNDSCAANRALEINPKAKYPSALYEQTIRDEVFRLCKENRYFVATTVFAKLGIILYFFLIYFGFIGVVCSYYYPRSWYLEFAFWAALAMSALPGVLTLPVTPYLIGFITVTILYTLYGVLYALQQGVLNDADKLYSKLLRTIKRIK